MNPAGRGPDVQPHQLSSVFLNAAVLDVLYITKMRNYAGPGSDARDGSWWRRIRPRAPRPNSACVSLR